MDILKLFQYEEKLSFTDIQAALKIRSNKLAYHLKKLTKNKILIKEDGYYALSEATECLVPYMAEKKSVLTVILIHIGDQNKVYLIKRTKRPYKNLLSLPGGRILAGESIEQAVSRIMKIKFNINAKLKKVRSISLEHLIKNNKNVNSFLLIFVSAETKEDIELKELKKVKDDVIKSDYKLLMEDLNKELRIKTIYSKSK